MKLTNYEAPQIEVIEIEIEDVLCSSSETDTNGGSPSSDSVLDGGGM